MKNRSRLTALLLALLMLMSALPVPALADDVITTMDDYQDAMQRLKDALNEPSIPQEQENAYTITRSAQIDAIVHETITGVIAEDGDNTFTLPVAGKLMLSTAEAAEAYQWQISADGVWANIVGDSAAEIALTYAKIQNALSGGAAIVRCALTRGGEVSYSPEAIVAVDMTPKTETTTVEETIPAVSYYAPAAQSQARALNADVLEANDAPSTYTILINYIFADGKQAAPSWSATVATGSTYTQNIQSPVVVGYTPSETVVHVNTSEAMTYNVTYQPAEVDYTVKHYQQNVSNDEYTLVDTETKKGFTENKVSEGLAKTDYTGFYSLLYDTTTTIAADGNTVVEVYYDRYYYLMNFDLDGGYGVEPIYARFGAPISVDETALKKPGYTFEKWDKEIPATMPAENTTYKASWNLGESGFTVVFWYENANDDGYSVAGTYTPADVAPGTQKKSEDYKNQSFTGRDDKHFTYNAAKSETVTVKGDGSTVLNVYYTRNTYTLTFKDGNIEIVCGKVEHEHSHEQCCTKTGWHLSCNSNKCPVGYVHEHTTGGWDTESCYKISDLKITAKYQQDIHRNFPIKEGNDTIWWDVPNGCESFKPGTMLGSIDTMPGENITFTKAGTQSGAVLYYYIETLNGETGTYTHDGKSFKLYKQITLEKECQLTYSEEFHNITGFTQWWSDPKFDKMEQGGVAYAGGNSWSGYYIKDKNYLCYTRNSYNLKFYNYNAYVDGKGGSVQYEAPLSSYDFEPEYPANLEKNAYVFAGWYTTDGCYEGSKADLNTMTMPASDVILYAKWAPKTHKVTTWLTNEMKTPVNVGDSNEQMVVHGSKATAPATPENGKYTFVGWFYKENGVEKAFDFSMPVNRDLNLYAKWSSNNLVEYTIKYAVKNADDTLTYIAKETKGSALAGTTKTFDAKTGTALNAGYQSGYFPEVSSHSLVMDINGNNEYTFIYVQKEKVPYTVKYLEKGTGNQLAEPKTVITNDAVVTETFKQITGYAPDAYQKQLVLAAEGNEIIFWYTKDNVHAPVQIIHWVQNIEGDGYTEYQSSTNLNVVIGQPYSETPLTIAGFEYNETRSNASGELTAAGLVLNLYYDRIEYPYEFRFVEKDSDPEKQLADSVTGSARYQAQVTQTANPIPGYTLVSLENQAINIAIEEDGTTAVKNVRTFYYTEQTVDIKYVVVGPTGCGTLDNYQEAQLKVMTGEVKGSIPTANPGFKFVGWFTDEPCDIRVENVITGAVDATTNKLTPQKRPSDNCHFAATYYAKFEYNLTTLTITKSGAAVNADGTGLDAGQSFLFKVTGAGLPDGGLLIAINGNGSETISGLTVGQEYTVTEETDWSWRYTPTNNGQKITLAANGNNEVKINNRRDEDQWLDGDCYAENNFGAVNSGK